MKKFRRSYAEVIVALLSVLALILSLTAPAMAKANVVESNVRFPIQIFVFVPCAAERVVLTGDLHMQTRTTVDSNGVFHLELVANPQGISGTGMMSGVRYQGTGVTRNSILGTNERVFTYVNNFRIIGNGPDNNLLVHVTMHVTVNTNGEVTAEVVNTSTECR